MGNIDDTGSPILSSLAEQLSCFALVSSPIPALGGIQSSCWGRKSSRKEGKGNEEGKGRREGEGKKERKGIEGEGKGKERGKRREEGKFKNWKGRESI